MCEGPYRFAISSGMYFCENNTWSVFKAFSRVFKLNETNVRSSIVVRMYLLLIAQAFDGRFEFFIEIVRRENDFARCRHASYTHTDTSCHSRSRILSMFPTVHIVVDTRCIGHVRARADSIVGRHVVVRIRLRRLARRTASRSI